MTIFQAGDTAVEDLSPLEGAPLTLIAVNNCRVKDLRPVRAMPKLGFLRCDGCPIDTLAPLIESTVNELVFDYRPQRGDGKVLEQMPKLTRINHMPAKEFHLSHGLSSEFR